MTIAEYEELTGLTVSTAETPKITATLKRAQTKLESLLGYSLSKQKTWTELGKVRYDGLIPFPSLPLNDDVLDNLLPPDDESGNTQLFSFNALDKHLRINPAKEVYRAKIVLPINEDEFITISELENLTPYLNSAGLVTALTRYESWFTWSWWTALPWGYTGKLQLAVDAKYINVCDADKYPDLAYLLADMTTYYADPNYSIMGNIRSESIDSHSYSRASTGATPDSAAPEGQITSKRIIEKYAGPAAFRVRVQ